MLHTPAYITAIRAYYRHRAYRRSGERRGREVEAGNEGKRGKKKTGTKEV